jgi:hypothetical protein
MGQSSEAGRERAADLPDASRPTRQRQEAHLADLFEDEGQDGSDLAACFDTECRCKGGLTSHQMTRTIQPKRRLRFRL